MSRIATILADIDLMEASGTNVFFRYDLTNGKAGKTDIMTPEAARSFIDTAQYMGVEFASIYMGREEQF